MNSELANAYNATGNIQNIITSSQFVKFTKETNFDIKNKKKNKNEKDKFKITINVEAIGKKLDNKENLSLRELREQKKIYYQPEDHELEDVMRASNKHAKYSKMSVKDIMYGIILNRREQLMKAIKDKKNVKDIVKNICDNKDELVELLTDDYMEVNKNKKVNDAKEDMDVEIEEKLVTENDPIN